MVLDVVSDDGGTWREAEPGEMHDLNLYRITPEGLMLFPRTPYPGNDRCRDKHNNLTENFAGADIDPPNPSHQE